MKYSKEDRLEIGRLIYEGHITTPMAAEKYDINFYTAREYLRAYKAHINVAIPREHRIEKADATLKQVGTEADKLAQMTKEELIDEVIRARINEARAKKGYEVKGGGASKKFLAIEKKNTK